MTDVQLLLTKIRDACCGVLCDHLTGIYVHGSLAFGCFTWARSDVDFLIVVKRRLFLHEKTALMQALLDFEGDYPPKGIEMSVVLEQDCRDFAHPMHYELHYSNTHRESCRENLAAYCERMQGNDPDLAAHCTVVRAVGYALCGKPAADVFAPVPAAAYLDSIYQDIACAGSDILDNPTYVTLNLCRVLAYLKDGSVLSKQQGGAWGIARLPAQWTPVITAAMTDYAGQGSYSCDAQALTGFADFMLREIDGCRQSHA